MQELSEYTEELRVLREAFEREAWFDEDGVVPDGSVTTVAGWGIDMQDVLGAVRAV
jgi:hypothetical protein